MTRNEIQSRDGRLKKAPVTLLSSAAVLSAVAAITSGPQLLRSCGAAEPAAIPVLPVRAVTESKVYFRENFQNYRDKAPTCIDDIGIEIENDPIWTQSAAANCNLKSSSLLFKQYAPAPAAAPNLKNYDVLFKFRLREDKNQNLGKFQLRLRADQKGKSGEVIVQISATEVQISSEGLNSSVAGTAKLPFTIAKNDWHTCALTVMDGKLAVFIDDNRVMKPVAQVIVPALPTAGINFYGFADSPFSVSDIVVRDPAALPDYSITNLLPAPQKINAAAFKSGGTQSVAANDIFGATVRTGLDKDAVKMTVNWADGKTSDLTFSVAGIPDERKVMKDGKEVKEKFERPDAIIRVAGLEGAKSQLDYHIRPLLRRYHTSYSFTDTYRDIVRDWDKLPKASEHPLKVELRRTATGADVYLDSCYAASLTGAGVRDVNFTLSPSASIGATFSQQAPDAAKYLPLDVSALGMAKSFVNAKASLNPGFSEVKGVPMFVAPGEGSADIGLTREGQGNWALEVDEYLARSPFDGLLTEVHFSVPGGTPYTRAWVLCAVDPDSEKDPILTSRITRYEENGIGGNRIADTTTTLPRGAEKPGAGVIPVGTVTKADKGGKKIEVPLYLVEVPLHTGKIIDLAMRESRLDFEFFGKPWENFEQLDNTIKPDPRSTSAVQVFGVTLEKSPVGLDFVQSQPGNIFHNDEKPETTAVLKSFVPGKGKLAWDVLDVEGKRVGGGSTDYTFARAGEEQQVNIPLKMPQLGWYRLNVSLQNEAGQTTLTHPAAFALLGKDERKAKYDSPYGTWWFDGAHYTPKELDFAGPIMFKAGIRKAAWTGQSEKAMEKWFITKDQGNIPFKFDDLKNPEVALKNGEAAVRKELEKYPHMREFAVFHESGPGNDLPVELIGLKPNLNADQLAREKRYADLLNFTGAFFREKFPQIKLVVGNNSASQANIAAILRHGGKPEYIDYIGIEAPSQVYIPEKLQEWAIQGNHIAKDTAKILSGKDIPATGCYEFTYRSERDMGLQQHAEWYTRDVLISLSNKFTRIGPGILFDTSNSYYNGLWGGSGILERAPYGYPKPAYVAYAALTNVLDQVTFKRQIPTGSTTVYASEFNRADGKLAAALWASRGEADFNLEFEGDTPVRVVDMYGRAKELKTTGGKLTVHGGTSPVYTLADKAIKSVTLSNRSFPKDQLRAKYSTVAAPLGAGDGVTLDTSTNLDTPKVFPLQTPIRQAGEFELHPVKDAEKGEALELELKTDKDKDLSKYITEYATLRLKNPAQVSGTPEALGVWVKGNSNWGRVLFEIEDSEGETWRSIGTGGWGCDVLDWPGNLSVNFDGWNFVALPLRASKLFNDHSPGPVSEQWVSGGGNKKIDYPIKIKALTVEMNRTPLDLIDFKKASPVIRLKDISGIEEK